jgi:hypothetical protein
MRSYWPPAQLPSGRYGSPVLRQQKPSTPPSQRPDNEYLWRAACRARCHPPSSAGAIVVVRPDQYAAHALPLSARDELSDFFAGFLLEPAQRGGTTAKGTKPKNGMAPSRDC